MRRFILLAQLVLLCATFSWGDEPERTETNGPLAIDIASTLQMAVNSSPTLERLRARVEQNRYALDEAYTVINPKVNFEAQYRRVEPPVTFSGGTVITPADNYSFSLVIQQPIYTFGRLRFGTLAARMEQRRAAEELRGQLQQVVSEGATLYIQARLADQALEIARDESRTQQEHLRVSQSLLEQGVVARFDVLTTGAAASEAQQREIEAETAREVAYARLRSFAALEHEQSLSLTEEPPLKPELLNAPVVREQVLERRFDLRALQWAVEAGQARVDLARADGGPRIALQNTTVNQNAAGFSPGTQNTTALVFSIPLSDGGASEARAKQAEAQVEQLRQDLEERRRAAALEIDETHRSLQDAWRAIEVAQARVLQAEEALKIASLRYQHGLSTTVELLDSQTSRAQARFAKAQAEADYNLLEWRWRRVAGLDLPSGLELPERFQEILSEAEK